MPFNILLSTSQKKETGSAPTVVGARNGLSLVGTYVELGGTIVAPAPMLHDSGIDMAAYRLSFKRGLSNLNIIGLGNAQSSGGILNIQYSPTQNANVPAVQLYGGDGGYLINEIRNIDSGDDTISWFDVVTGFFEDEGIKMGSFGDGHATSPSVSFVNSKGSAELRIATGAGNIYNAPITFGIEDVEQMRIEGGAGNILMGVTANINNAFKLQVKGTTSYAALFTTVSGRNTVGVLSAGGGGIVYFGPEAGSNNPYGIWLNNVNDEMGRVLYAGGFSAPAAAGFGFNGSNGTQGGLYENAGSPATVLMGPANGNIFFGIPGNESFFGTFGRASGDFTVTGGGLATLSGGTSTNYNTWKLGQVLAGAVVVDTANYVEVNIAGTIVKLIIAV